MSYNVEEYKKIYNDTYTNIKNYNFHNIIKDIYVDIYAAHVNGKILDAGCGEGIHLKRLLNEGYDAFGIELSDICCKNFLLNVPHKNIDIEEFAKLNQRFDGIICMDVLEHIPPQNIESTLNALTNISKSIFLGIANHSDKLNGTELHLIQKDNKWWQNLLKKYYKNVYFITEQFNGRFYYFYCNNEDIEDRTYLILNKSFKRIIKMENEKDTLVEINRQLNIKVKKMNTEIINKDKNYKILENNFNKIVNSFAYKIIKPLIK